MQYNLEIFMTHLQQHFFATKNNFKLQLQQIGNFCTLNVFHKSTISQIIIYIAKQKRHTLKPFQVEFPKVELGASLPVIG